MKITKIFRVFLVLNFLLFTGAQEAITNNQRIFELLNYGPVGLLYGILPPIVGSLNISEQCSFSLNHTIDALANGELWSNLSK